MKEKNYYELLEIDKNASKEIIEKAYKTLVKKYHPDVQSDMSDDLIKKINEAYETISSPEKREAYNTSLSGNEISEEEYNKLAMENRFLQKQNLELTSKLESIVNENVNSMQEPPKTQYNPSIYKNNNYYNQEPKPSNSFNYNNFKNYTNHYNMQDNSTIKNLLSLFITFVLLSCIAILLWNIPFTKQYLISTYESNEAVRSIMNIFKN